MITFVDVHEVTFEAELDRRGVGRALMLWGFLQEWRLSLPYI